mgnify:CR=1 FL=1
MARKNYGRPYLEREMQEGERTGYWYAAVHYTESGKRHHLSCKLVNENGEPFVCYPADTRDAGRNKKAATRAMNAWFSKIRGTSSVANMSVFEYVTNDFHKRANLSPSTISSYETSATYIRRGLEGVALKELTTAIVSDWVSDLAKDGYAPVTISKAYNLLHQVCEHAVEREDIPSNPCTKRIKRDYVPKSPAPDPDALDSNEIRRLNALLDEEGPTRLSLSARLALQCGLRAQEVCGLRWEDVDMEEGIMFIRRSIGRTNDGSTFVKVPKSATSRRALRLNADILSALRVRRKQAFQAWVALDKDTGGMTVPAFPECYVVGYPDGRYLDPHNLSVKWKKFATKHKVAGMHGKPLTFHALRHTFASALVGESVDVRAVASLLGHADPATTVRYYAASDPAKLGGIMEAPGVLTERPHPAEVISMDKTGTDGS